MKRKLWKLRSHHRPLIMVGPSPVLVLNEFNQHYNVCQSSASQSINQLSISQSSFSQSISPSVSQSVNQSSESQSLSHLSVSQSSVNQLWDGQSFNQSSVTQSVDESVVSQLVSQSFSQSVIRQSVSRRITVIAWGVLYNHFHDHLPGKTRNADFFPKREFRCNALTL